MPGRRPDQHGKRWHEALRILQNGSFDLAIVYINLNGEPFCPVATELRGRTSFICRSPATATCFDHELVTAPLPKPYSMQQLLKATAALIA